MTDSRWRLVAIIAALLTVGCAGFALGAGLASEPRSAPASAATPEIPESSPLDGAATTPAATDSSADRDTTAASAGSEGPAAPTVAVPGTGESAGAERVEIAIVDFAFSPAELSVAAGTTVVFVNEDDAVHNVLSEDGQLQSPDLAKGDTYEVTLEQSGEIPYICNIHQFMRGTITVTA